MYVQRTTSRLSALLHDVLHAYLMHFVCKMCPTATMNYAQAVLHARAFQNFTAALEKVSFSVLGVQFDLVHEYSFRYH
jgi:hypothetical protein